ncbi:MAG: hypothetical protein WCI71_01270, partial [Bacteroidota bacterium]
MMKNIFFFLLMFLVSNGGLFSQIAVNHDGTGAASSAMLDVKSNNGGFLPPRMTLIQRNAIQNPAE